MDTVLKAGECAGFNGGVCNVVSVELAASVGLRDKLPGGLLKDIAAGGLENISDD